MGTNNQKEEGGVAGLGLTRERLAQEILPAYVTGRRWFSGHGRRLVRLDLDVVDLVPFPNGGLATWLLLFTAQFAEGAAQSYALFLRRQPAAGRWTLHDGGAGGGFLVDAVAEDDFCRTLLEQVASAGDLPVGPGRLVGRPTSMLSGLWPRGPVAVTYPGHEQSHTSVELGDRLLLKVYRQVQRGTNPEVEMGEYLSIRREFPHVARLAGSLTYEDGAGGGVVALGILQERIDATGDAWTRTLEFLERYLTGRWQDDAGRRNFLTRALAGVERLGQRVGELHACLATAKDEPAFAPEPLSGPEWGAWCQELAHALQTTADRIEGERRHLPPPLASAWRQAWARGPQLLAFVRAAGQTPPSLAKIRIHGDLHLGQVLCTRQDDVVFIDFEGEPGRPLAERRRKHLPLRDVAGMVRSFGYAARMARRRWPGPGRAARAAAWERQAVARFLAGYQRARAEPVDHRSWLACLDLFCLEKVLYECRYEIDHRPDWLEIPVAGLIRQLNRLR
ncbi:MAG: Trehalose synthase [Candidatus Ozemobacter sibiricus]|jgi:maltose alpha-D-glucosyltransferase/alpha-amylase|uniref:Trehalose synthase n=1 Tax=Candidatus Ozemobacter sibiricus TaxID=2268124 RepID=A0A367ZTV6_9BACT|nr:MAG: Trehalose synthase [Candidatus Ozemobacter sibiricus]